MNITALTERLKLNRKFKIKRTRQCHWVAGQLILNYCWPDYKLKKKKIVINL